MKITNTIVACAVLITTSFAFAAPKGPGDVGSVGDSTVQASDIKVGPSDVDQVVSLLKKTENGVTKKVQILVQDNGLSTDVSPRYKIHLGYSSSAEMGNITANFQISDLTWEFVSAKRISAGIYEVKAIEIAEEDFGFDDVTYLIDATKMFSDEKAALKKCGGDFCDQSLATSIKVTKTAKKRN